VGRPKDAEGKAYGGGDNDLANTLALAKRAKAQGMKLLLDFHYSDFWTDPGKQFKPKAWEKMDYPQLKTIHDYTRDTIARFKQRACCRIWCRSAMKSTAECCGRKAKAGGRAAVSLTAGRAAQRRH
jgi:arabinogalactan endo-1,4-beta-galactosidase